MKFTFKPSLVSSISCGVLFVLGLILANWQYQKGLVKAQMQEVIQRNWREEAVNWKPQTLSDLPEVYARVKLKGQWRKDALIVVDNRPFNGQSGHQFFMPLQLENSPIAVLVMRGWAPRNIRDRQTFTLPTTPDGLISIEGIVRARPDKSFSLGQEAPLKFNELRQNFDIPDVSSLTGLQLMPLIVEQVSVTQDGLMRELPDVSHLADKHFGYTFQWLALSVLTLVFYLVIGFKREHPKHRNESNE